MKINECVCSTIHSIIVWIERETYAVSVQYIMDVCSLMAKKGKVREHQ